MRVCSLQSSLQAVKTVDKETGLSKPPAVQTIDVTKNYRIGHIDYPALKGISITVERGELTAIIGPSGSGKTTLLNVIGALDKPTSGRVIINGRDLSKLTDDQLALVRNREIGFMFQSFNLIQRLKAIENVEMPLITRGLSGEVRKKRALDALRVVGLALKGNKRPTELSGGEQQRVAIARALVTKPSIVIADEPTGNLDTKTTDEIIRYIVQLNKNLGSTFVVVTHNADVARMTRRVISIRDGLVEKDEHLKRIDAYTA